MKLVVFSCSAAIAGAVAGAGLGAAGSTLPAPARIAIATGLALVGVGLGTLEVTGRRVTPLQRNRETPQRWVHAGPSRWAIMNGAALGFGAATRIGFTLWYVVPVSALLFADPVLGAAIYGAYGATRGAAAWLLMRAGQITESFDAVTTWLLARAATARKFAAGQLLVVGMAAVIGVGL